MLVQSHPQFRTLSQCKAGQPMELFMLDGRTYPGVNSNNYDPADIEILGQAQLTGLKAALKPSEAR